MDHILGVIGGLGTETSCTFCVNVNQAVLKSIHEQPRIIMDNVSMSNKAFGTLASGDFSSETLGLLVDSVIRLNQAKVDLIIIPCNTVHVFIDTLRRVSQVPIMSIIEETAKVCSERKLKKVGLLGSSMTIKEKLHSSVLTRQGIEVIVPSTEDQLFMDEFILKVINQENNESDSSRVIEMIKRFVDQDAQAIILGCTDLFLAIKPEHSPIPLINTTEVIEKSAINWLLSK